MKIKKRIDSFKPWSFLPPIFFPGKTMAAEPFTSHPKKPSPLFHLLLALGLMGVFFALDLFLPLGVAGGVPYVTVVLAGWWLGPASYLIPLAIASSILIGLGYLFSPEGGTLWVVLINRLLALFAIWVTTFGLVLAKRSQQLQKDVSRQKQTEEDLLSSKELLETVVEGVPAWLWVAFSNRIVMVNQKMADDLGKPLEFFPGTTISNIFWLPDEEKEDYRQLIDKMVETGRAVVREGTMIGLENGLMEHTLESITPLKNKDGDIIGIVGVAMDITQRKKAETERKKSEERLIDAIESIPDAFVLFDAEDKLVLSNQNYKDIFPHIAHKIVEGLAFKDLIQILISEGNVVEAIGKEELWIARRMENHLNPKNPVEQKLVDGTWVRFQERKTREGGIVGLRTDITPIKQAQEALRLSEQRFRAMFDNSPSAIIMKDTEGIFKMANREFQKWRNLSESEIIGKTVFHLYTKEYAEKLNRDDLYVIENQKGVEGEQEYMGGDGKLRNLSYVKFPVLTQEQEVLGVGAIYSDLTEIKKTETLLRETQKNEAVGKLAGGIAHDFNNLLQIIINYALLAQEEKGDSEELPDFLKQITLASERAATLTRQLLAFSRKTTLQKQPVNLGELAEEMMKMLGRVIGEDIDLQISNEANTPLVDADPGLLEQVILNLCINARDALPDGGVISMETAPFHVDFEFSQSHNWAMPGHYVLFSLSDNGTGMTVEVRDQIFEPFFTTKDVGQGTGLGLAMVQGIVQQHEGMIFVYSEKNVGTTFKIYLPVSEDETLKDVQPQTTASQGGTETILIAEDEKEVRQLLEMLLRRKGYHVLLAVDGQEALEVFEKNADQINLAILDVMMPKHNGREIQTHISKTHPHLPVMFSTGYSDKILDAGLLETKGVHIISKPYAPAELYAKVREILDAGTS